MLFFFFSPPVSIFLSLSLVGKKIKSSNMTYQGLGEILEQIYKSRYLDSWHRTLGKEAMESPVTCPDDQNINHGESMTLLPLIVFLNRSPPSLCSFCFSALLWKMLPVDKIKSIARAVITSEVQRYQQPYLHFGPVWAWGLLEMESKREPTKIA